jgi:hypothetical protein
MPPVLAVQQPQDERQDHTDDNARHNREIDVNVPALDHCRQAAGRGLAC